MNFEENEMARWPNELDDIGEEYAKNDGSIQNLVSKKPKYIYR